MARLLILGSFAYVMVGLAQLVIGAVMEPMVNEYGVGYGDGGQLVMHQFLGGMVGVLSGPWLMRKFGKRRLILTALALIAVVQAVYALQPAWPVMLAVAPIIGIGFGITESTVGTFIIAAAGDKANTAMSRVEVAFGVGALLMPFLGAMLISAGYWKMSFAVVCVMAVAVFTCWLLFWPKILDMSSAPASAAESHAQAQTQSRAAAGGKERLTFILCIAFFIVYVGFEMSYIHYLPSMMVQDNGLSESTASLSISLYWLTMVVGRLVAGHAADRFGGAAYLIAMCGANAVLFLLMIGLTGVVSTFVLAAFIGLAMSGMFSIALVYANRVVPGATERTTSVLIAAGGIGGAFLPKLTGWFLDRFDVDMTRWLFAAFGIVLMLVIVWAVSAANKSGRAAQTLASAASSSRSV